MQIRRPATRKKPRAGELGANEAVYLRDVDLLVHPALDANRAAFPVILDQMMEDEEDIRMKRAISEKCNVSRLSKRGCTSDVAEIRYYSSIISQLFPRC